MRQLKSVINTRPNDIHPGDVFAVTVTFHVGYDGIHVYRCPYPNPEVSDDGIPQGDDILDEDVEALTRALVPVLLWRDDRQLSVTCLP